MLIATRKTVADLIEGPVMESLPMNRDDMLALADYVLATLKAQAAGSARDALAAALHEVECGCGDPSNVSHDLADAAVIAIRAMSPQQRAELHLDQ
jgi:hypothetical protein